METKLHENIRLFRKGRGLTQEQLAEALQVSPGVISKWELEPRPIYVKQTEKRQKDHCNFPAYLLS